MCLQSSIFRRWGETVVINASALGQFNLRTNQIFARTEVAKSILGKISRDFTASRTLAYALLTLFSRVGMLGGQRRARLLP